MKKKNAPEASRACKKKIIEDFVSRIHKGVSRIECAECGKINGFDFYMVKNSVWKQAGLKRNQFCCLDCLSKRLGRDLSIGDFGAKALINRQVIFGYLMARAEFSRARGRESRMAKLPRLPDLPGGDRRRKRPGIPRKKR